MSSNASRGGAVEKENSNGTRTSAGYQEYQKDNTPVEETHFIFLRSSSRVSSSDSEKRSVYHVPCCRTRLRNMFIDKPLLIS
jgi:hypothetical protein